MLKHLRFLCEELLSEELIEFNAKHVLRICSDNNIIEQSHTKCSNNFLYAPSVCKRNSVFVSIMWSASYILYYGNPLYESRKHNIIQFRKNSINWFRNFKRTIGKEATCFEGFCFGNFYKRKCKEALDVMQPVKHCVYSWWQKAI